MKTPLPALVFLALAAASGAEDNRSAAPREKKLKTQVEDAAPQLNGSTADGGGSGRAEFVLGAGPSKKKPAKPGLPPPKATQSFAKAKVSVSVSPSGPWVQNGEVCGSAAVYSRTTGLDRNKPPKGCASPFDSSDCLDVSKHRDFLPSEWVDPFTIQTVVNGPDYPSGKYAMYLSYSKTDIKQVGFATLKTCAAPAPTCRWDTREAVIGPCGGPGCNGSVPCTTANRGQTGAGGGGTWTCVCK